MTNDPIDHDNFYSGSRHYPSDHGMHEALYYGQRERSPEEKSMPEWQRDALDRQAQLFATNAAQNPAVMAALTHIESKLDKVLSALANDMGAQYPKRRGP